ncbi:hypothetical protein yc1106_00324 [Curvularia clavata]|uniref:Telomeric single stranded DNA binding POT1/Cdc13 domain-containing protein n=1 Tax=Curvularia clavata TaxID=95742 RepID=A0A9Q8Z054_CURCL|nr:hypothetical protein yc1106_00324 [Curvularia clavata]
MRRKERQVAQTSVHQQQDQTHGLFFGLVAIPAPLQRDVAFKPITRDSHPAMEQTPIAQISPELVALESKHFRATVTLIWPYSSSARQLALLLAEPDVRSRRRNGQVRARFSGASAKAIATTGIGIGDEVVLSLRGAQFVSEGTVSTPGKSIDWELEYAQTVVIRVFRHSEETANIELIDAPPTQTPKSPLHQQSRAAPSPTLKFSSPAFLKRARLSDGPFFEASYDPLLDEADEGHDKKRRRKSYRDWKAWTYSARTPSPEKEDVTMDDELELLEASPSRAAQLPRTPTSPSKSAVVPAAETPQHAQDNKQIGLETSTDNNVLPPDAEYAFGGDTEVDTEVNTEEEDPAQGEAEANQTNTTEGNIEGVQRTEREALENNTVAASQVRVAVETSGDVVEVDDKEQATETASPSRQFDAPRLAMPPPTLLTLQNDLQSTSSAGLLTPIGKEPKSPTLRPLDSTNLPIPSPFPVEREDNATSYFDQLIANEQAKETEAEGEEEESPPSEASYIGETSFFSSIGSSKASGLHPNHESVFTPLRFTFGLDGAGSSRPMELSSPSPESQLDGERGKSPELSASTTVVDTSFASSLPQNTEEVETGNEQVQETGTSDVHIDTESQHPNTTRLSSSGFSAEKTEQMTADHSVYTDTDRVFEDNAPIHPTSHSGTNEAIEESEEEQEPSARMHGALIQEEHSQAFSHEQDQHQHHPQSMDLETRDTFEASDEQKETNTSSREPDLSQDVVPTEQSFSVDHSYEADMEATDDYLQDAFPLGHMSQEFQDGHHTHSEQYPAFQEESMEDHFHSQLDQSSAAMVSEMSNVSASEQSAAAFKQSHDVDEVQTEDVPAGNTRSKAKVETSPVADEVPASVRTTRSTRSRGSVSSITRSVISPPRTHARSAHSPPQGATQASPSSVRSQSRLLSPEAGFSAIASTATRESPRRFLQRSLNKEFAAVRSESEARGPSITSQKQDVSEGERSHDDFTKDTDKVAEHSVSPDMPSEEFAGIGKAEFSSPMKHDVSGNEGSLDSKPSSERGLEAKTKSKAKAERKKTASKTVVEAQNNQSVSTELDTPSRRLRSKGSVESTTESPRVLRRTRRNVYNLTESQETEEASAIDPKTDGKHGADLRQGEGEGPARLQVDQQKQRLMTPDATQQTAESQSSFTAGATEQNSLLTPQPTQRTFTDPHSTQTDIDMDAMAASPSGKKTPLKFTPRRGRSAIKEVSASLSPTLIEKPSLKTDPDRAEEPSVGLSTPLAYYTPLKDLVFFLNRSSQFHSSANPDILALVTSATTSSEKAKKGPKHWNTTLHVTDVSSWPATTTVQCFRAYREALPEATVGDVILLRAFGVKSLNRHPTLVSADESAWCVWHWGKPVEVAQKGAFAELKAREEVRGPEVERGEGELHEVERLRNWFEAKVKQELQEKEESQVKTRSRDKAKGAASGSSDV